MLIGDTIVAISSAVGAGTAARAIVRTSGPEAHRMARLVVEDAPELALGAASPVRVRLGTLPPIPAQVYRFASPRSVTGEDVVEFHLPGNPLLCRMLIDALIAGGARQAEPGEFTARAYFHGKFDLAEAEGVAAAVGAHSRAELEAARRLMSGELARRLAPMMESLAHTLALVEAEIDFSDEGAVFVAPDQVRASLGQIDADLKRLADESPRLERLAREPQVVLAGRPNAGKSTLLNALAGRQRAVVSDIAGTTRDVLWTHVKLARGIVRITDVAGIDLDARPPATPIDALASIAAQMDASARRAVETADFLVLVRDATDARPVLTLDRAPDLVVRTKCDLRQVESHMCVSAHTGTGLDVLRERLDAVVFGSARAAGADALALNARHLRSIADARTAIARAAEAVATSAGAELVALELREALDAVGQVLGRVTPDDVLGRIFATFCIGK